MWLSPRTSNAVHCSPSPAPSLVSSHLINLTLTGPQSFPWQPSPPAPHIVLTQVPVSSLMLFPAQNSLFGATLSAGTPQARGA